MKKNSPIILFVLMIFCCSCNLLADENFDVVNIVTDAGSSAWSNQFAIQFNRPVVTYGTRDQSALPIEVSPNVNCNWQWVNDGLLVCFLSNGERFSLATKYNITIKKEFKTYTGVELGQDKTFSFTTLKPDFSHIEIIAWKDSDKPVFKMTFNQIINIKNLEEVIFIAPDGDINKKSKIKLLDETKYLTDSQVKQLKDNMERLFPNGGVDEKENKEVIFFEPEGHLNDRPKFKVYIDDGIRSAHGIETIAGIEEAFTFKIFDKPELIGISCTNFKNGSYYEVKIGVDDKLDESKKCLPNMGIHLNFSSPIFTQEALKYLKFTPKLSADIINNIYEQLTISDEEKQYGYNGYRFDNNESGVYSIPLHGSFDANKTYTLQSILSQRDELPSKLSNLFNFPVASKANKSAYDIFGKEFKQKINFNFTFDHYQPELFFPHNEEINVLEKSMDTDLEVSSRNFKEILVKYNIITSDIKSKNQAFSKKIEGNDDIFLRTSLEIRKLLKEKSGLIFGELSAEPRLSNYPEYKSNFLTQVTNFGIIGKIGHYNSLVFVTDLTTGEAVPNAEVSLIKAKFLEFNGSDSEVIASGETDKNGILMLPGTEKFDQNLQALQRYYDSDGLTIQVKKKDEMGWLPIRYNHAMSVWQIPEMMNFSSKKYGHLNGWAFTSHSIYKPDQEVDYKLYIRNNENEKMVSISGLTYTLTINDPTGVSVFEKNDIALSDFGTYFGKYKLSKNAKSGWYNIVIFPNLTDIGITKEEYTQHSNIILGKFLVSDFRTSSFKIRTELNKTDVLNKDELEITNYGELYSGGAFSNAIASVNIDIEPKFFESNLRIAKGFNFTNLEKYKNLFITQVSSKNGKTDAHGEFLNKIKIENNKIPYGKIIVDSSFQDDSGKSITDRSYANYFGVDRFIGMKTVDFFFNVNKKSPIQFLVMNSNGELLENIDAHIDIQFGENSVIQLKTGGSTYKPKAFTEWKSIGSCDAKSKLDIAECEFNFEKPGDYRAIAKIIDSKNLESTSLIHFIVFDDNANNITWRQKNDENFDIIPEKMHYKVGERVKFMVKNPLIGANALITTERYGVIKQFTKKFDKSLEILEFDLDESDAPGFYLSIVLTTPRVHEAINNNGAVDGIKINTLQKRLEENSIQQEDENKLYKPIAKIGYSRIFVENPENKINIDISIDKELYKPKETSVVKLSFGHDNKANEVELAVIVIDEAVLDLVHNRINYFNPHTAFSQLRSLDVMNYSLFKTILTSAHAMSKGADVGGDAGLDFSVRSNFMNIAYWNPSIKLKKGESAEIQFEVPDNLTSWKVIVVSNDKNDLFGLNDQSFKVSKKTEIRPLFPDHVLTGDRFDGGFTIFNRSDKIRNIAYEVNVSGMIAKTLNMKSKYMDTVTLEPSTRKIVRFPVFTEQINENNIALFKNKENEMIDNKISFLVTVFDEIDNDSAAYSVKVLPAIRFENYFNNKIIENGQLKTEMSISNDSIGGMSSLKIDLNNTILNNLLNIFSFMKDYQYSCFEQKLSKMFVEANYLNLKKNVLKNNHDKIFADFKWDGIEQEIKDLYEQIPNYQAENGGISYYLASDSYTSPYLSAMTLSTLLKFEKIINIDGLTDLSKTKEKLIVYLDNLLKNSFQYQKYNQIFESDVRSVILEAFAMKNNKSDDILRFKDDFKKMSLFGKAKLLNGAILSQIDESLIKKWWSEIMQSAIFDGAQYLYFQKDRSDFYNPMMHASKYTENCAILSAAVNLQQSQYDINEITGSDKENLQKVLGKIANAIINRNDGKKNFNTHEAILCTEAIAQYSLANENLKLSSEKAEIHIDEQSNNIINKGFSIPGGVDIKDLTSLVGKNSEINVSIQDDEEKNKNLYYSSHLSLAKALNFNEMTNHGIEIRRKYKIEKDGKFSDIKDFNQLNSGSIIKVILSIVAPFDKYFVVVDDYIPGCFEPIDQNQNTTLKINDENHNNLSFYYRDLKQNYARFYSDFLPKGSYEVSYLAQVISNGAFDILPAVVKEMYNEESFGITNSEKITIKDTNQP